MSANTTVARPYAKALFELALDHKALSQWSLWLNSLVELVSQSSVQAFLKNSSTSSEMHVDVLCTLVQKTGVGPMDEYLSNFIHLLADQKRLNVLPEIAHQFNTLRATEEKTLLVHVTSFKVLTKPQQERLIDALSRRLDRRVSLDVSVDETLLGGAVIRANDLVIDGSVRGKLTTLGAELAA
ncbi:MAG: F0F1 ATP synthase subunit delta [Legionellaceae bacterium]